MKRKYSKKPVVVEAEQYTGQNRPEGVCFGECRSKNLWLGDAVPHIHTLEGDHTVSVGDYVITGVKGEHYPCKPDIFEMTYEEHTADDPANRPPAAWRYE